MRLKLGSAALICMSLSCPAFASQGKFDLKSLQKFLTEKKLTVQDSGSEDDWESGSEDGEQSLREAIESSVIKIHVTGNAHNFADPWQAPQEENGSGSGFVIKARGGLRLMTNAHVVANHARIKVTRPDKRKKFTAEVEFIGHDCDLAILKVLEEDDFFEDLTPLEFGGLTQKREEVEVYGYPAGGEAQSITRGTISRTEVQEYAHSGFDLLCTQTDAAINPGNSGGPVINEEGLVVGVAFQGADELENTGYMIPVPVIEHFLSEVEKGAYRGFPVLGVSFQELENSALRKRYKITSDQNGMLVTSISKTSPAKELLKTGDVVTSIDGINIDNDLKYNLDKRLRISYEHLIRSKYIDDKLVLEVIREGQKVSVIVPLPFNNRDFELIPSTSYDQRPSYYIFGGCVFQPLITECFGASCSLDMLSTLNQEKQNPDQELVLLNQVKAADVNEGYHDFRSKLVDTVNGQKVNNMKHMISILNTSEDEFIEIVFTDKSIMVLDRQEAVSANAEILKSYFIDSPCSSNYL